MKPKKNILLIIPVVVTIFFLALGIGCFNPDKETTTPTQDQSGDEHMHSETEAHDDHDHDLHDHDEVDHDEEHAETDDHADEHAHSEAEVHDEHDHDLHDHDEADHGGHDGEKSSQVTVWDDRFEIFMEHPFVVVNSPTAFITHITDRVVFQPVRKGPVSFVLTDPSGNSTRHVEPSPARAGIFIPKLSFPQSGEWQMSLVVTVKQKEYNIELPTLNVYSSQAEANRAPAPKEVDGISFLKEQQWRMPFETRAIKQRTINSQDVLAVQASAIVDEEKNPAAFVQLAGETFIKRYLKLGEKEAGFIQVSSGLSPGEYVVTQGTYAVAEVEHQKDHDDHDHEGHNDHDNEGHDDHDHEGHDDHDDSIVKLSEADMKRFGIEVEKVKSGEIKQFVRVPGEIVINSDTLAHIVPRVPGIVQQVKKNLGDFVKKGEVLAVVESRELADIKAAYLTSIESFQLAEPFYKREERLWKKKISSEQEYLDAKKAFAEAKIEMNKAKYKLSALGFSMEYIKNLPSEPPHLFTSYEITAPFNGTITKKHITLGEVVKEDDDIFVVADLDTVWVDLRVPQKDALSVRKGQKVTISGKSDTTKTQGRIDYVHSLIDEQTRTKLARVVLDNTTGQFLPGTFVTATVQLGNSETDVVVDKSVIQDIDDKACVFVQSEQGFEPRPVRIGRSNDTCVEIIDGLESGEIIVTENSFRIKAQLEKAAAGEHAGHGHSH